MQRVIHPAFRQASHGWNAPPTHASFQTQRLPLSNASPCTQAQFLRPSPSHLTRSEADLTAATPSGWTPLHEAANASSAEAAAALLEHGALAVAQDNVHGWTPLHVATHRYAARARACQCDVCRRETVRAPLNCARTHSRANSLARELTRACYLVALPAMARWRGRFVHAQIGTHARAHAHTHACACSPYERTHAHTHKRMRASSRPSTTHNPLTTVITREHTRTRVPAYQHAQNSPRTCTRA
eukprot:5702211-Pleurochrysis_carterae.AAC.1